MCQCEDRPCCGCDAEVSRYDHEPDPDEMRERFMESIYWGSKEDDKECRLCGVEFDDDTNEDDVVQGFHAECAENRD